MNKKRIVVLDDQKITLNAIKQNLDSTGLKFELCSTYEEMQIAIMKEQTDFLIADIIQLDKGSLLEQLKEIKKNCDGIKIAVITAKNYITKDSVKDQGGDKFFKKPLDWQALKNFIFPPKISSEVLDKLKAQLQAGGFLNQIIHNMNIGISILDAERNVLYVNNKQKEISGEPILNEPCFKSFAYPATSFCSPCPIDNPLEIATHVRIKGYYDINCIPLKGEEENILGYAKLSIEVNERKRHLSLFREVPLKIRIGKILDAIKTIGFSRVHMYVVSEGGKYLIGYATNGNDKSNSDFIGKYVLIEEDIYAKRAFESKNPVIHDKIDDNEKKGICLKNSPDRKILNQLGMIPIYNNNTPVGLITIDNYDKDYPDITKEKIRPIEYEALKKASDYRQLIVTALDAQLDINKIEIANMLAEVDKEIYNRSSIDEMLQVLILKCISVIENYWEYVFSKDDPDFIISGHIMRHREGMLEKIAGKGIIYEKGIKYADLRRDKEVPCVKVYNRELDEIYKDTITQEEYWKKFIEKVEKENRCCKEAVEYYKKIRSLCCLPIRIGNEIIGTLSIQSPKPYVFNDYIKNIVDNFVAKCIPALKGIYLLDIHKQLNLSIMGFTNIINYLLEERENEENLIWIMLTGLTHHDGLGYNRAVFFEYINNEYIGKFAVGKLTRADAKQLYDEIQKKAQQGNPVGLKNAISDAKNTNSELTNYIKGKKICNSSFNNAFVIKSLDSSIWPEQGTVLPVPILYGNNIYGGLLLDNFETGILATKEKIDLLKTASSIFSLVIHNMRVDKAKEFDLFQMIFHQLRTDIAGPLDMVKLAIEENDKEYINLELLIKKLWDLFINSNDLLFDSKLRVLEDEGHRIERVELYPNELVSDIIVNFKHYKRNFIDNIPDNLTFCADKGMIRHALINLLDNSIKYSDDGSTISINAEQSPNNGMVSIYVKSSPKTPLEDKNPEEYFNRFAKGPDSQGAGIGLYIVKKIAEKHEGYVFARHEKENIIFGFSITLK